jgi:hypothetical protein
VPFQHLLLTRFNLRRTGPPPGEEWLRHRLELFRRYTVASVVTQSSPAFRWLVLVDHESPTWLLDELAGLLGDDRYETVPLDAIGGLPPIAAEHVGAGTTHLITSRLDNDDAIARDFVASVQAAFAGQDFEFVNFTNGLQLAAGRLLLTQQRVSPFVSLIERVEDGALPRTVHLCRHSEVGAHGPVLELSTHPMWLQVLHDRNLSNHPQGLPVRPSDVLGGIGIERPACLDERSVLPAQARYLTGLAARIARHPRTARRVLDLERAYRLRGA